MTRSPETIFEQMIHEVKQSGDFYVERAKIAIAEQIAKAMKQAGVSKAELARRLGKSRAYVTQILQGDVNFTVESLVKIAESLGYKLELKLNRNLEASYWENFDVDRFDKSKESKNCSSQPKNVNMIDDKEGQWAA